MGIDKLEKAAQAAGLAMAAPDDEPETRIKTRRADAWTYAGPRKPAASEAVKPAARAESNWNVWSYLTGKATA